MDTFDEIVQLDDDIPMSAQVKNQQYTMINSWMIPDLSMRFLDQGSIQDENQDNVWTNLATVGDIEGITDESFAVTTPQPQLYIAQNNQVIDTFWIEGNINILVKVKTNTFATIDNSEGQTIGDGTLVVYARNYSNTYSHTDTNSVGGVATIPLSTSDDSNNTTGTYSLDYDNESSGPFTPGEEIALADYSASGIIVSLDDQGTTGTITYILTSSTNFSNNDSFSGNSSGSSADVNGAPTPLVAGYTDITLTFASTSQDLGNGNGSAPYDCTIDCNTRPLDEVYEYLKYITAKEYTGTLNGTTGNQYQAVGDIYLAYDTQTGNFSQGGLLTGATSGATGYIVADHDSGASGFLCLRQVKGIFQNNESITDETAGAALVNGNAESIPRVEAAPFGTLAGGKFFAARGVWIYNMDASDANNYELIDSTGTRQIPPATVSITVSNTASGDRVSIFETTGSGSEEIDKEQYSSHATNNSSASTSYEVAASTPIQSDTPTTGSLRIVDSSTRTEERIAYTSWTGNVFTLTSSHSGGYDSTDFAYVPYIDEQATSDSVSKSITYTADRNVVTRVRIVGMLPYSVPGKITSSGLSVTVIRTTDSNYTP